MVEAEVARFEIVARAAEHLGIALHDGDGHVADVQDLVIIGEYAARGLGNDGGRVGVVDDPRLGRELADLRDDLDDLGDGAQAVREAARAAGLLADEPVLEGDFFVLFTHLHVAGADLHEGEVDVGEGDIRVIGPDELVHFGVVLAKQDLAVLGHDLLALLVDVVEHEATDGELLLVAHEGRHHLRVADGAASHEHDVVLLHD